jgi:hypothetical protein
MYFAWGSHTGEDDRLAFTWPGEKGELQMLSPIPKYSVEQQGIRCRDGSGLRINVSRKFAGRFSKFQGFHLKNAFSVENQPNAEVSSRFSEKFVGLFDRPQFAGVLSGFRNVLQRKIRQTKRGERSETMVLCPSAKSISEGF